MPNKIAKLEEAKQGWIQDLHFTDRQKALIKQLVAKDLNEDEFNLFVYRCLGLGLDPLKNEISCQIRSGQDGRQLVVIVQRDGYLTIAHKSGFFGGMESGTREDDKNRIIGWAKVWNKSFYEHPVAIEVYLDEYNAKVNVWNTKPRTMIQKVAESQALRRAFNISGVYSEEEVDSWEKPQAQLPTRSDDDAPADDAQKKAILQLAESLGMIKEGNPTNNIPSVLTKRQARERIQELVAMKSQAK